MDTQSKDNSQYKQGYLYAVRLLSASKKSERELAKRLKEKGYPEPVTQEVIHKLKEQRILSDKKLTEEAVQTSLFEKRYGPNRIFYKLRQRGISEQDARKAVQAYPKSVERETAKELARAKWEKLKKVEPQKRKSRLYSFLVSRGFSHDLSRDIVTKLELKTNEDF